VGGDSVVNIWMAYYGPLYAFHLKSGFHNILVCM
jgi:hypothetical protein